MPAAVTDQAMAKIKDLIVSGEYPAGAKLPREQDLAAQLGLSRNSLREAVRALSLIGVLDARVGDGTYVTSLDAGVLLEGLGFVAELLEGATLIEAHQVRRILEPVATAMATSRLTEDDFAALEACLEAMSEATTVSAFIDADVEFHRIIVDAAGNATLASLIQGFSGRTSRARLWRTITEHDAAKITKQRHHDIYDALRAGDAEQASAADLVHLADVERWLEWLSQEHQFGTRDGSGGGPEDAAAKVHGYRPPFRVGPGDSAPRRRSE
jgi:GntR family transcriptional repressor for pyruvate dehydrogenase complex